MSRSPAGALFPRAAVHGGSERVFGWAFGGPAQVGERAVPSALLTSVVRSWGVGCLDQPQGAWELESLGGRGCQVSLR